LDVEGPTTETSVSVTGTMKGIPVQEMLTFIGTPTTEKGVIHGVGKGVVTALGGGVEIHLMASIIENVLYVQSFYVVICLCQKVQILMAYQNYMRKVERFEFL
jgi:uncharacterized membrane protein YeiH